MRTPAWQKRESERQELLSKLMNELETTIEETTTHLVSPEAVERDRHGFLCGVAKSMIETLRGQSISDVPAGVVLRRNIYPQIKSFARSEAERKALIARLLERHVFPTVLSPFYAELQREEIHEPQKIFLTERSTDEVEL